MMHGIPLRRNRMARIVRNLLLAGVLVAAPLVIHSQTLPAAKPTLTRSDYAKFESIGGAALSPDGKWIAYVISKGERAGGGGGGRGGNGPAGELHYRAIASDDD